jgi:hypothetical protein
MPSWWTDDRALAYAILEQGRVTAERLLVEAADPVERLAYTTAHRGFGLAAYLVSEELLPGVRPALWFMIDEAGPAALGGPDGSSQALMFAVHGSVAVERCLDGEAELERMQEAHRAVRESHTALTALVGVPSAASLTIEAAREGRLTRTWQREHLRPPRIDELEPRREPALALSARPPAL